jgi:hypothetical protein
LLELLGTECRIGLVQSIEVNIDRVGKVWHRVSPWFAVGFAADLER